MCLASLIQVIWWDTTVPYAFPVQVYKYLYEYFVDILYEYFVDIL